MTSATTNWRQRIRDYAGRAGLPRFWRWWMSELALLLPGASRAAFQRRFARPVIQLSDGQAVFWRPEISDGVARLAAVESVTLAGETAAVLAAGRAAVARLAATSSGGIAAPKVIIALGSRQILRKELLLPAAVEENLAQTLAYDLDRHTPFRPEQLYFDAAVTARDPVKKSLRVDWVAALRTIVDGARKQVEDWGAIPIAVAPGPPSAAPTRLNLLPNAARPRPLQWGRWQVWAPLALIALLVGAAVFVPLVQKRQYAIALAGLNAEVGQQAQVADKLRQQLEQMQGDYNYILAKKYAYPSVVHVLDEVTRVLPDDTWITQLELKTGGRGKETQRDVYLRGESANAGKLIALLEDSKLVDQVSPRSPTTKIQGSAGEIFDLGARLRGLPAPQAIALTADMPPPVPVATPAARPSLPTASASPVNEAQNPSGSVRAAGSPPAAAAATTRAAGGNVSAPPTAAPAASADEGAEADDASSNAQRARLPGAAARRARAAQRATQQAAPAVPAPAPQPEAAQVVPSAPAEGSADAGGSETPAEGEQKTEEQ